MLLERLLSIHVGCMVALSALMVGMDQRRVVLYILVPGTVVVSIWLVDFTGRFRLNRTLGNMVMLGAVLFCAWDFFRKLGPSETVVMANLLVAIQIALLLQRKDVRTWVQLIVLSVLQLTVATLSSQTIWLGALSLIYLFIGLSTLALLFLYHEQYAYRRYRVAQETTADSGKRFFRLEVDWERLKKVALATLVVGPLSLFLRYGESAGADPAGEEDQKGPKGTGRWPLIRLAPMGLHPEEAHDQRLGIGWRLWACLARLIPATLLVGVILFPLVPRFGRFDLVIYRLGWFVANESTEPIRRTGFSDEVALGELGLLAEDMGKVAEVRFYEPDSEEPYQAEGAVYLRGAVLTRYTKGQWNYAGPGKRLTMSRGEQPERSIRQDITVEPMDRNELFCVWPVVLRDLGEHVRYNWQTERLQRSERKRKERFSFAVPTTGIVDGRVARLAPCSGPVETSHLLSLPRGQMHNVEMLANQWTEQSNAGEDEWAGCALFLESRLLDSGRFAYSSLESPRDPGLDPIEDFLVNNPTGNCEYFATALALMLRSRGIPARVVVGYKTDEYSNLTDHYVVRQSHAHTWVEAYLDPGHLPTDWPDIQRFDAWPHGGWLRLDPTPARDLTGVQALFSGMENWLAWVMHMWDTYVSGMNSQRQRDVVYGPLNSGIRPGGSSILDPEWWKSLWGALCAGPKAMVSLMAERVWLGALTLLVALALLYLLLRVLRLAWRPARDFLARRRLRTPDRRPVMVAFYRRLEALLKRHGLARSDTQTQREFASQAGRRIAQSTGQRQLADLPVEITEAFYRVRFGGRVLDSRQTRSVEQALDRLEQAADGQPVPGRPHSRPAAPRGSPHSAVRTRP